MTTSAKILIVEDEVELAEIFRDYLYAGEYDVSMIHTGEGVVELVKSSPPDLILLDLMLPEVDGLTICKQVREFSNVPIIMITAKVDEIDRLLGLDIGADDYICKPAKPREVVARIRAVLRRTLQPTATTEVSQSPLEIDLNAFKATYDGVEIDLTRVEFRLLDLLNSNPGTIFSRNQIMKEIYNDGRVVNDRSIDSHIKNLRQKLSVISKLENPIRSVYGVGYKLELENS